MTALRKSSAAWVTPVVGLPRNQRVRVGEGEAMVRVVQSPAAEMRIEKGEEEGEGSGWWG